MRFITAVEDHINTDTVIIGVPYDGTSCGRKGADSAPNKIRSASGLIETYSPYQNRDLTEFKIADGGDMDIPRSNPLELIEKQAKAIFKEKAVPIFFGGEHSITIPIIKAAAERYPDLHVLVLDAHADLRDEWLGGRYSHACTVRRIAELIGWDRIKQFGVRSGTKEEFETASKFSLFVKFTPEAIKEAVKHLRGKPVYLSLDIDVFDPSLAPGTGTPEPGGISYPQFLEFLNVITDLNIIGGDIVEVCPPLDSNGITAVLAASCAREIILKLQVTSYK